MAQLTDNTETTSPFTLKLHLLQPVAALLQDTDRPMDTAQRSYKGK